MTEAEAKTKLIDDGYPTIYSWFESPDTEYEEHSHPNDRAYIVLEGMMTVGLNGEMTEYYSGQMFVVGTGVLHTTVFGPDGCLYLVGEK